MQRRIRSDKQRDAIILSGVSALLVSLIWSFWGWTYAATALCAILSLLLACQLIKQSILIRWLRHTGPPSLPHARGVWGEIFDAINHREREKYQQLEQLHRTLEQFHSAGHAMPDGIIYLSGTDTIEWLNTKAEQHFGLNHDRDIKVPLIGLVRQQELADYLHAERHDEPLTIQSPRRSAIRLSIQLIPFSNDQKILVSRDITQIEQLENMRRDFIANVSHELRTPLTVVGGFVETVIDGLDDLPHEDVRHFLDLTLEQSTRMQRLIGDLLTLSALETGAPAPSEEPVDVSALIGQVYRETVALSAGRHEIELTTDGYDSDDILLGSQKELYSAFANLATNAVRYTPAGGHIRLAWKHGDTGAEFSVTDDGIGIPAQHLPRLTERFFRVDRGRSRETGGTGLGLAIVKHIALRHYAALHIESKPGLGSRFSIAFPAEQLTKRDQVTISNAT